jgi:hypothetical protein
MCSITKKLQTRACAEGEEKHRFRILQTKQKREVVVFIIEAENDIPLTAIILQLTTALRRKVLFICKEGENRKRLEEQGNKTDSFILQSV